MNKQLLATFWSGEFGSTGLWIGILATLALGFGMMFLFSIAPTRARKFIVGGFTFIAGLFYVLLYFWPSAPQKKAGEIPRDLTESVSFWLQDSVSIVGTIANILTVFLLGLGIYSLLRIHAGKLMKMQKDWVFSLILLIAMFSMVFFGYADFIQKHREGGELLNFPENWGFVQYAKDLLFDGLLQQMDAAMFSLIAFFILSAAYRAFRIRSIESTILLAAALIMMLSLMGGLEYIWSQGVNKITGDDPGSFLNNFKLKAMADWISSNVQTPSLRAIDFGIGVGALAMGLRLWLSLERGGMSTS